MNFRQKSDEKSKLKDFLNGKIKVVFVFIFTRFTMVTQNNTIECSKV